MSATRYFPADKSTALHASQTRWTGLTLLAASDDIRRPTEWQIHEPHHTVIVHLGGRMNHLETELESHGGSRGPALPGESWTVPAGQRYTSRAHGGIIDYAVLSLDLAPPTAWMDGVNRPFDLAPGSAIRDPFLHQSVLQLLDAATEKSDLARMFGQSLSQLLWLHLHRTHNTAPSHAARVSGNHLAYDATRARKLRDFIHDRLSESLGIEQLAGLVGQTTHQMLISFRATFGKTPWQYIIAERLRCAERLLKDSTMDITTIAFESGFSSHSHLTRVFRERLNCSPSEYRASHRSVWLPSWR